MRLPWSDLGCSEKHQLVLDESELAAHPHLARLEVDVAPPESTQLAAAHSGEGTEPEEGQVLAVCGGRVSHCGASLSERLGSACPRTADTAGGVLVLV